MTSPFMPFDARRVGSAPVPQSRPVPFQPFVPSLPTQPRTTKKPKRGIPPLAPTGPLGTQPTALTNPFMAFQRAGIETADPIADATTPTPRSPVTPLPATPAPVEPPGPLAPPVATVTPPAPPAGPLSWEGWKPGAGERVEEFSGGPSAEPDANGQYAPEAIAEALKYLGTVPAKLRSHVATWSTNPLLRHAYEVFAGSAGGKEWQLGLDLMNRGGTDAKWGGDTTKDGDDYWLRMANEGIEAQRAGNAGQQALNERVDGQDVFSTFDAEKALREELGGYADPIDAGAIENYRLQRFNDPDKAEKNAERLRLSDAWQTQAEGGRLSREDRVRIGLSGDVRKPFEAAPGSNTGITKHEADPFEDFSEPGAPVSNPSTASQGPRELDHNTPGTYQSLGFRITPDGNAYDLATGHKLPYDEMRRRATGGGYSVIDRVQRMPNESPSAYANRVRIAAEKRKQDARQSAQNARY